MAQPGIEALFDRQIEAMAAKDLDRLMSFYTADVVYFDVVPPLRYVGSAALRDRFRHWFDGYAGPLTMDVRDRTVAAAGDLVVVHWLSRARGTLHSGVQVGSWVRATSCWRRTPEGWLVAHEHVSLPVDVATRTPATDLEP